MKDPKSAVDAATLIAAGFSWATVENIIGSLAGLCAIAWYSYRFYRDDGFTKLKDWFERL